MYDEQENEEGYRWIKALLGETYFRVCRSHAAVRKSEKNMFCAHCCIAICQHCLPFHPSHFIIQIRRYVYNDVIRVDDIQKLVDCEPVQPYIVNSAKVVFLNERPQARPAKGVENVCETCDRILQDGFRFCSLACRVDAASITGGRISKGTVNAPLPLNLEPLQHSPKCVFPYATSSGYSPSSSVSTDNDMPPTAPCVLSDTPKWASTTWAADFSGKSFNRPHSNLSKLEGYTLSSKHLTTSLKYVSSPVALKWARRVRWPASSKLAKKLPFTPYSKLPRGHFEHTSEPSYSLDHSISCYPDLAHGINPLEVMVCSGMPLPKRRKGMPQRSPIC